MTKKTSAPDEVKIAVHCSHAELKHWSELRPNPDNPNTHGEDQLNRLAEIVKFHGWRHPVIVSKRSGMIVAGHARYTVAKKLNTVCPVDYQDFTDEAAEISFLHADNRIAELSELDMKASSALLEKIKDSPALEFSGFTADEIAKMKTDVAGHTRSKGLGAKAIVQYNIIFDNPDQQAIWFAFVRKLKKDFADKETIGARLTAFLEKQGN